MDYWRQKGPLGKLHNLVVYIQRSPQRIAKFWEFSNNRNLARDNSTRWNSWYMMISTAIQLKSALELFFLYYKEVHLDVLLEKDWDDLAKLQSF
jgi:hypothetical protein